MHWTDNELRSAGSMATYAHLKAADLPVLKRVQGCKHWNAQHTWSDRLLLTVSHRDSLKGFFAAKSG